MRPAPPRPEPPPSPALLFGPRRPVGLHRLRMPANWTLAVVAPHPDDFDAVAVTLRHFQAHGHTVHLLVLTSGARGVEDSFCSPPLPEIKARTRQIEQRQSCRFFGLPPEQLAFLNLIEGSDGEVADTASNMNRLRQRLEDLRPHLVVMPHGNDTNTGHRRAWTMVRAILEGWSRPVAVLLNEDPKTVALRRDVIMPFAAEDAEWKARLLRFHASQHQRNLHTRGHGLDKRILDVNRRAYQALKPVAGAPKARYAEAFELHLVAAR